MRLDTAKSYSKPFTLSYQTIICGLSVLLVCALSGNPATTPSERMPLSPKSLLLDVASINDEIIVVGERGHILKSRDEGTTWRQIVTPTRATLTNVRFLDYRYGWASGHSGVILSTSDGGDSWNMISDVDPEISYFDAWFFDERNGVFIGAYGEYVTTDDAGVSLKKEWISEEELHFYDISSSPEGTLYIAGEAGQLLKSRNQGLTWKTVDLPYSGSLFGILTLDDDTLLTYGLRGHLLRSTDGGESWKTIETDTMAMLTDAVVLASGTILISTITETLLLSGDGGVSFHTLNQDGIDGTVALTESSSGSTVFLCGRHGVLPVATELLENALKAANAVND